MNWLRRKVEEVRPGQSQAPPDQAGTPTIKHPFVPWRWRDGREVCMHRLDSGQMCDRPADEHAPALEEGKAGT